MIDFIIGVIVGLFIGMFCGVVVSALCVASKDADTHYDTLRNYYEKGNEDGLRSAKAGKEEETE